MAILCPRWANRCPDGAFAPPAVDTDQRKPSFSDGSAGRDARPKYARNGGVTAPEKGRERAATPSEIAQQIASAEARAYRDGFDAAMREAKAESDRRAALALEEIGIALRGIAQVGRASCRERVKNAV